jgi:hypothetical protein
VGINPTTASRENNWKVAEHSVLSVCQKEQCSREYHGRCVPGLRYSKNQDSAVGALEYLSPGHLAPPRLQSG